MSYNQLSCQTFARLGLDRLPSLKKLVLRGNRLTRFEGAHFDLPSLESVDLGGNEIKLIRKKNLPRLKELDLSGNRLKDLEGLSTPNLAVFKVADNKCVVLSRSRSVPGSARARP